MSDHPHTPSGTPHGTSTGVPAARYVVVEGGEGVGKTTQVAALADRLATAGIACKVVREPGGDPFAEAGRELLLGPVDRSPATEVLFFNALRAQLLTNVVAPLLANDTWVLSDRGRLSTIAYQGHGSGADLGWTRTICELTTALCPPDLELVIDLDPVAAVERRTARGDDDRYERMDLAYHQRVNEAYRTEADRSDIEVIDGDGTPAEVTERLWIRVSALIDGR